MFKTCADCLLFLVVSLSLASCIGMVNPTSLTSSGSPDGGSGSSGGKWATLFFGGTELRNTSPAKTGLVIVIECEGCFGRARSTSRT